MLIAVCDDRLDELGQIKELLTYYIQANPHTFHIDYFDSPHALLHSEIPLCEFQLFLLDIVMPKMNGIDLAKQIRLSNSHAAIIFLTTSKDFALDAFRVQAYQYLLKPISPDSLFPVLDKILAIDQNQKNKSLSVKTPHGFVNILCRELSHIEFRNHTFYYYLSDGTQIISSYSRSSFTSTIAPLLNEEQFIQTHKSYIINISHVRRFLGKTFEMSDGSCIPVSRNRFPEVKKKYLGILSKSQKSITNSLKNHY
ncbi:LytR/AlgR family response regulator transcription factor [Christensenella tenuis]|uniref:Stage 0 sporulation protein A homolog n=1 Tax=Christensenella tenuis TaxID=2763033 RepID=A0ABR7EGV8_9FIRM|nr:response regulator transcription factor [Christensenella tenuis]